MIKRSTWILLGILALMVVAYFVIKNRNSTTASVATPTGLDTSYLITPADGTLQILHISDQNNHAFQMQRDTSATWVVTLPTTGTADQSLAAAAETQVGALRIVSSLEKTLNLDAAGLKTAAYTIELTFSSGQKHIIRVGTITPTNNGYYVDLDSSNLYIVSQAGIDALLNLLTAPPFPATETPAPFFTETLINPTIEVLTPTPSLELATPTP
jgi:hypothetical protein